MATLYVMCGLPGAGKSTYVDELRKVHPNTMVVSMDAIRKEMYGDESDQSHNGTVFGIAMNLIHSILEHNIDVIYDATNVSAKDRKSLVRRFKGEADRMICVHVNTTYDVCVHRDAARERTVGTSVIDRMRKKLTTPTLDEGWDRIITITKENK